MSKKIVSTDLQKVGNKFKTEIVWKNVVIISVIHVFAIYGYYLMVSSSKWQTTHFTFFFTLFSTLLGITAGAHRLWSHRSYKAKFPLRVILMISNTIALQNDIYEWCRDHRVHHKYSETDADPHDSRRGFFFAHMGWLMCRKHPAVKQKGKALDLTDVWADPVVRFQRKHYYFLVFIFWFLTPTLIPYFLWKENIVNSIMICVFFRYVYSLHSTWLVNSAAHKWGNKPYEKNIEPRENTGVVYASFGEGYHNYHHTFPWDYSTSEFGWKYNFNFTTLMIDSLVYLGLAYDRKTVSKDILVLRMNRSGDGSWLPTKSIQHWIIGIVFTTWVLWLSFILRYFLIE